MNGAKIGAKGGDQNKGNKGDRASYIQVGLCSGDMGLVGVMAVTVVLQS